MILDLKVSFFNHHTNQLTDILIGDFMEVKDSKEPVIDCILQGLRGCKAIAVSYYVSRETTIENFNRAKVDVFCENTLPLKSFWKVLTGVKNN